MGGVEERVCLQSALQRRRRHLCFVCKNFEQRVTVFRGIVMKEKLREDFC